VNVQLLKLSMQTLCILLHSLTEHIRLFNYPIEFYACAPERLGISDSQPALNSNHANLPRNKAARGPSSTLSIQVDSHKLAFLMDRSVTSLAESNLTASTWLQRE
jgi:hypothetical protein